MRANRSRRIGAVLKWAGFLAGAGGGIPARAHRDLRRRPDEGSADEVRQSDGLHAGGREDDVGALHNLPSPAPCGLQLDEFREH